MALFRSSYHSLPDEELMSLVARRDQKAFGVLYDRYGKLMYNYFHKMLWQDREKSRDFTQDLFAKLVHKPELYDSSRPFKTWIYSIAHNMCKNEYSKVEVRRNAREELEYRPATEQRDEAQSAIDRQEFNIKLQEALDELDEVKRATFEMRFRHEMSIEEISEAMQCSQGTVKSRLFYTLKQLNQKLKVFEGIA
ncbi:MAG: RNA polymerase sigma factor [Flavobacteriales bacterium]|nr:RNA polymerase sigma factor [Flavobacteriales bacterium]